MSDEQNKKFPEPELSRRKIVPLKEYGLLKVLEFPDGTVIHVNTERGKENLRIYHSSGTYDEITSEGTRISFNSNNGVSYSKGGFSFSYDQSSDSKAGGHGRVSFDHDVHIEAKKNASIVVGGHADLASLGHLKLAAKGNMYLGADAKVVISGGKGIELNGRKGRIMAEADGVVYLHSKSGDVHLEASQDVVQSSGQDNVVVAGGKVSETSDGDNEVKAQGSMTEEVGGDVNTTVSGGINSSSTKKTIIKSKDTVEVNGTQRGATTKEFDP